MRAALFLPGQGYQQLGLLKSAASKFPKKIHPLLEQIDEALPHLRLSTALTGDSYQKDITCTEIAQPLILAATWANYELFKPHRYNYPYVMGHSMGEYSAFVIARFLSIRDALKLVHARGQAMRDATIGTENTGMSLIIRPSKVSASEFSSRLDHVCCENNLDIANVNSSTQTTISGLNDDIKAAATSLKGEFGRVIVKPLRVSGAFHSRYMAPAQAKLGELVATVRWNFSNEVKVVSNQTARPYTSLEEVEGACISALVSPVRWLDSALFVSNEVEKIVSLGPGNIGRLTEKDLMIPTEYLDLA